MSQPFLFPAQLRHPQTCLFLEREKTAAACFSSYRPDFQHEL